MRKHRGENSGPAHHCGCHLCLDERARFVEHLREMHERNEKLQARLDQAIAREAKRQAHEMQPAPESFQATSESRHVLVA